MQSSASTRTACAGRVAPRPGNRKQRSPVAVQAALHPAPESSKRALAALAAAAAAFTLHCGGGSALAASLESTVPLKRAIVEDMLLQRLTDRLHSLSDQQLAELLEQLLRPDASFPNELLLAPRPPLEPARQQQQQQWEPAPLPAPAQAAAGVSAERSESGSTGSGGGGSGSSAGGTEEAAPASSSLKEAEQLEGSDLTQQLLQGFQEQVTGRSGSTSSSSAADSLTDSLLPGLAGALAANWRLALVAVAGPAALIATLSLLSGVKGQQGQQGQEPADASLPKAPAALPEAPQQAQQQQQQDAAALQGQEQKQWSFLSWLFPPEDAADDSEPAPLSSGKGLAADAAAGRQPLAQQVQPDVALPPPMPPPPPLAQAAAPAMAGAAEAGSVLWRRKDEAAGPAGASGSGDGSVLWQRKQGASAARAPVAQPPAGAAQRLQGQEQQAGPQGMKAGAAAAGSQGASLERSHASSAGPVDLWRVPLEQLRAGSGSGTPAEAAEQAQAAAAAADVPASAPSSPAAAELDPVGHAGAGQPWTEQQQQAMPGSSETEAAPTGAAASPAQDADAGEQATPASLPELERSDGGRASVLSRRQVDAMDNAEPEGWLGRLQRMSRRPPTAAGSHGDGGE